MSNLNVVQVNYFKFLLDEYEHQGFSTKGIMKKSRLENFNLENTDNYVPVQCYHDMLFQMHHNELGNEMLSFFRKALLVENLANFGSVLLSSPDIFSAIYNAITHSPYCYSTQKLGLYIEGEKSTVWLKFTEAPTSATRFLYEIEFGLIMDHFRLALGSHWDPLEIHFPDNHIPDIDKYLYQPKKVKILGRSNHIGFVFPTKALKKKFPNPQQSNFSYKLNNFSQKTKIEAILDANRPGIIPSIVEIAGYFNISERSLRRNLAAENISYSKILDEWRFKQAIELLETDNLSIKDLSLQLGYQKSQNFARAFNRWTGLSPHIYREKLSLK